MEMQRFRSSKGHFANDLFFNQSRKQLAVSYCVRCGIYQCQIIWVSHEMCFVCPIFDTALIDLIDN